MARYRLKPLEVEAAQWNKNGDHPLDNIRELGQRGGKPLLSEGEIVRYYRSPSTPGRSLCPACHKPMHDHGWIDDARNAGVQYTVCPGDWIIRDRHGIFHPVRPDIFEQSYEPAGSSEPMVTMPFSRYSERLELAALHGATHVLTIDGFVR